MGLIMAHSGNAFALRTRDKLVDKANRESPILRNFQHDNRISAAGLDATGNALAGLLSAAAGYCVPAGYWVALYRGWIGGIVSVENLHHSRLATPDGAYYYATVLLMQLIPFVLVGGAGVNLGLAAFTNNARLVYRGSRVPWLRIPHDALRDALWIYVTSLPLFAMASLFEFTM